MTQPDWCNYPDATRQRWGCWSLLEGRVTSKDFCKDCECNKDSEYWKNRRK